MDWPMSGKPRLLYLDNAAEFKSEALRRGCEQHGIRLDYRPLGQPHYGGIVERIIGTAMQMIHDELPGTTFSNPDQRGEYASEKMAALTLRELERWLTLAVGTYHGSVHNGLLQPPAARWAEAITRTGVPTVITRYGFSGRFSAHHPPHADPHRLRHRPHPLLRRCAQAVDSSARPLPAFLIRRDPRDISRIWVLEPEGSTTWKFPTVPCRTRLSPSGNNDRRWRNCGSKGANRWMSRRCSA
jgi:putative transposase